MQTEEEMKAQLLEAGLKDAVFEPGDGRVIEGAEMERLCRTLAALEDSLVALERRGISLRAHAVRQDPASGQLPIYHVFLGHDEHWFTTREKLDEFLAKQEAGGGRGAEADRRAETADGDGDGEPPTAAPATADGDGNGSRPAACTSSSSTRSARSTTSWPSSARWASRSRV